MSLSGTLPCFLCKASIYYEKHDKSKLMAHMNSEHNAAFEMQTDFLLALCILNMDERLAIIDVVKDKDPGHFESDTEAPETDTEYDTAENNVQITDYEEEENELNISALTPEITLQEVNDIDVELGQELREESVPPPKPTVEFQCTECPRTFNLKIKLNRHLKLHSKKDLAKSEFVELKKESPKFSGTKNKKKQGLKVKALALQEDRADEGFPCPECGKVFRTAGNMKYHFVDIHQPGEFPCRGCQKMFTSRNKMSSHFSRYCREGATRRKSSC